MPTARRAWPILLLLLAGVMVPTLSVLWFMGEAVRNQRLAVRQRLTEFGRPVLAGAAGRLEEHWRKRADELTTAAERASSPEAFARLVTSGLCDSAIVYDPSGNVLYPVREQAPGLEYSLDSPQWQQAQNLEFVRKDYLAAAAAYAEMSRAETDPNVVACTLQAQARCLARAGSANVAVVVLAVTLTNPVYRSARSPGGQLIVPGAQLMAMELMGPQYPLFGQTADFVAERLSDYGPPVMPSPERVFLMHRLLELAPDRTLPTLDAEELAERYLAAGASVPAFSSLARTPVDGVWQMPSSDRRATALFTRERLAREVTEVIAAGPELKAARIQVVPPGSLSSAERGTESQESFLEAPAGDYLPEWRLVLELTGADPFGAASQEQVAFYVWTGILVVAFTAVLAVVVGRYLLRQVRVTRLRNDFIATVTHELKTPLASMRALVDTLREGHYRDQQQVRDYLDLIARENTRLSRLIDNFLSFSRMERSKRVLDFTRVDPTELVQAAAESTRARIESDGGRLDLEVADGLPTLTADPDALVTVLVNLLDNACKYSDNSRARCVQLRAWSEDESVCFQVRDNGIGIPRRALRKVFDRFYQVDQSLSRSSGGCGLGLSIVKFIVDAHGGTVDVQSEVGVGSTFTVKLPVR